MDLWVKDQEESVEFHPQMHPIDEEGMEEKEARAMAQHVLNFFGYSERIIDNVLEPEDRDAFYILEDSGLLTTEREETTLYDGREWRIHYWLLAKKTILRYSNNQWISTKHKNRQPSQHDNIYSYLPKDMWTTRKNPAI